MARLRPAPRGLDPIRRLSYWAARRIYGSTLEPTQIIAHHRPILAGYGMFALCNDRFARSVEPRHKNLAMLRTAQLIGCEWCLDFGSKLAHEGNIPTEDLRELARWRDSERFDAVDRLVLEYAEAMTRTPVEVADELFEQLRARFDERQMVELTMAIGAENLYSRTNWAFGIESEGFAEGMYCVTPDRSPSPSLVADAVSR
jgi:AhpD family alkylhydroperoxidase